MRTIIRNAGLLMCLGLGMLTVGEGCAWLVGMTDQQAGSAAGTGGQGGTGAGTTSVTGGTGGTATTSGGTGGTVNNCSVEGMVNCDDADPDCETNVIDNPAHCGSCSNACEVEGYCLKDTCAYVDIIATSADFHPYRLIVTASHVLWTEPSDIWRVPLGGGPIEEFVKFLSGMSIATDGSSLFFFSDAVGAYNVSAKLLTAEPGGYGTALGPPDGDQLTDIAVNATRVYWADPSKKRVRGMLKTGGSVFDVSTDIQPSIQAVLANDDDVYWHASTMIRRAPPDGGASTVLVQDEFAIRDLAADGDGLFWVTGVTTGAPWTVRRRAPNGDITTLATEDKPTNAASIAINQTHVFWAIRDQGEIWRSNKDGTGVVRLTNAAGFPIDIAPGANYVYWTDPTGHRIMRIAAE